MDVKDALDINTMEIPDEWRHACELADELANLNTAFHSRISIECPVVDQLYHRGYGSDETQDLLDDMGLTNESQIPGAKKESGYVKGTEAYQLLSMGEPYYSTMLIRNIMTFVTIISPSPA